MEELAEASIEDTDGAGLQPAIALRRPRGQVRQERTTCYYRGFKYTRAWASSRKIAYRCSRFRTGCRATMAFTIATMGYSAVRSHTCRAAVPAVGRLQDVTTATMNRADTLAIEQIDLPARLIWEALRDEFYGSGNGNVLPVPVEIPEDIADDSDSDEPLALEHASDSSLNEESNDDEEEGTGFSV
ncbi:hypothetical protein PI125_g2941 [Phytophthora idaei]|nr:hypothetical protein PI125_g2941 [Phytophthora idaei]